MIRSLIILISFCAVMLSCKKPAADSCNFTASTVVVPASEMTSLQAYVATRLTLPILHPGGFITRSWQQVPEQLHLQSVQT